MTITKILTIILHLHQTLQGSVIVVFTMVTDATKLKALPIKFVWIVVPAVEKVTPELDIIVPTIELPVAIVAALPTAQKTFFA